MPWGAQSMKNFVTEISPLITWVHLSDEPHAYTHSGGHMGDGNIDFDECLELLEQNLGDETVATIEVKDGHKQNILGKLCDQLSSLQL